MRLLSCFLVSLMLLCGCSRTQKAYTGHLKNRYELLPVELPEISLPPLPQTEIQLEVQAYRDSSFYLDNVTLAPEGRFMLTSKTDTLDFNGFHSAFINSIVYPELCREMLIQGKVYCKINFDKKGNCLTPEILRSPDQVLEKEALRCIKVLLNGANISFHPYRMKHMILVVSFRLN